MQNATKEDSDQTAQADLNFRCAHISDGIISDGATQTVFAFFHISSTISSV